MLLKAAEEVSDEITEHASGIERGLIWSHGACSGNGPWRGRCLA
ncbi:hypothetical protein CF161_13153 [Pseudomonas sp. CF161]|nr:hypothetical protein CF161_13153 [Pseudomonas sp. CF161]